MYNPQNKIMVPVDAHVSNSPVPRNWTRFEEGEQILVKNVLMYVHEIGESRLILKFKQKD